jgi:5-methylthioadenosine/S-adenosylhomocysteine deaminase
MRAVLGQGVIDFPAPGVPDPSLNIAHAGAYVDKWKGVSPLITPAIFCHSPYTCSEKTLAAAKQRSRDRGVRFQIHVAETRDEVNRMKARCGVSPVAYLAGLGILDSATQVVHGIWVDEADIALLARSGASLAHCPESSLKLGAGIAPVPAMLRAGIPIGLGTDGSASNNDLDLFGEMDTAAKIHKGLALDPTVMDAATVIRMATIEGARAIGLENHIGSLEPGKQADLIVIDTAKAHLTPLYHPASHIVYAVKGTDVRHVMVAGRLVVEDRCLLSFDLNPVIDAVRALARRIGRR